MGVRAEQQALAKHGLNYVIDTYLPRSSSTRSGFCRNESEPYGARRTHRLQVTATRAHDLA